MPPRDSFWFFPCEENDPFNMVEFVVAIAILILFPLAFSLALVCGK